MDSESLDKNDSLNFNEVLLVNLFTVDLIDYLGVSNNLVFYFANEGFYENILEQFLNYEMLIFSNKF